MAQTRKFIVPFILPFMLTSLAYAQGTTTVVPVADPVYQAISACQNFPIAYPASTLGGTSSSGSASGPSSGSAQSCSISDCPGSAIQMDLAGLGYCDQQAPSGGSTWLTCVQAYFTGAWDQLTFQFDGSHQAVESYGGCGRYNSHIRKTAEAIRGQWACLRGGFQQANSSSTFVSSMSTPVRRLLKVLDESSVACNGGGGTSSSGWIPPGVVSFPGSSSGAVHTGSSGTSAASPPGQAAPLTIGFTTGSATIDQALTDGINGTLTGSEQATFRQKCANNPQCFFQQVAAGSEAAYDLGLGGDSTNGSTMAVYGKVYMYCAKVWTLEPPAGSGEGIGCAAPAGSN